MFPKEHGAYAQLLFPIATALAIGRPGVTAVALAVATVGAFLAHEPLLVLLGLRGSRAGRDQRARAVAWFTSFALLAIVSGVVAIYTASAFARGALATPVLPALLLSIAILSGREHTVIGEVMSGLTLSSVAHPIGVASLASSRASLSCAAAFAAAFTVGVVCVHAVISFTRHPPAVGPRLAGAGAAVAAVTICWGLAMRGTLESIAPIAAAPASLAGLALVAVPPSARNLRVVGWTLVATNVLTAAALVAVFR